jgi:hypothetical protein
VSNVNRLAKYFTDAASCSDCGGQLPPAPDDMVAELEQQVATLLERCREKKFDDAALARVFTICIVRIVLGGSHGT